MEATLSEGKRPGGLTALAVLNFVFGGLGAIGILGMVALMAFINSKAGGPETDHAKEQLAKAWEQVGIGVFYLSLAIGAVSAILLIVSGIGYLKQRKFLGRTLGTAYAFVSIASSVVMGVLVTPEAGGGFSIGTLVGLVYPVLTLVLLNTTFKEDLTR